jgi:hypothetical protein
MRFLYGMIMEKVSQFEVYEMTIKKFKYYIKYTYHKELIVVSSILCIK